MNPIIVSAIINGTCLIIVAVINLIVGLRRRDRVSTDREPSPAAPPEKTRKLGAGKSPDKLRGVTRILAVVFSLGLIGSGLAWRFQRPTVVQSPLRISITTVPPAGAGGPDRIEPIGGTVKGTVPADARVVVYAYAGGQWFVQPDTKYPFTLIEGHAWATSTRLGAQYAALLVVGSSFTAPSVTTALPVGASVLSVAQVAGR
jgi:hypothetical protein